MRKLGLIVAVLVVIAFLPFPGRAAPAGPEARARAALALAKSQLEATTPNGRAGRFCACTSPEDCICTKGKCDCGYCGNRAVAGLNYEQGYAKAVAENKPLLVWVGHYTVPGYTSHWAAAAGWVQCVKDRLADCPGGGLCAARPDGQGGLERLGCVPDKDRPVQEAEVLLMLQRPSVIHAASAPPVTFRAAPQFFAPAPAAFGGFGGGMRFGGGFGGACRGGG